MTRLCITGEMGSGKSYCSKIFEQLGIPVFYTDDISKQIINSSELRSFLANGKLKMKDGRSVKPIKIVAQ